MCVCDCVQLRAEAVVIMRACSCVLAEQEAAGYDAGMEIDNMLQQQDVHLYGNMHGMHMTADWSLNDDDDSPLVGNRLVSSHSSKDFVR